MVASKANQGDYDDLLKHIADLRWSRRYENVTQLDTVDEITYIGKENHIIVLPEEAKMTAIEAFILKSNFYVKYLHWDNNGRLDGFIDHSDRIYLLNGNYDIRKSICDKIFLYVQNL